MSSENRKRALKPATEERPSDEGGKLEITVVIGENPLSLSLSLQLLSAECH